MLVLGRKVGQKILIEDDVVITIVAISDTIVKIGIDAPKEVTILREEIKGKPKKTSATLANGS